MRIPEIGELHRVVVVDDDEMTRRSWARQIMDGDLEPVLQDDPLSDTVDRCVSELQQRGDALLCDHNLTPKRTGGLRLYAKFLGAEVVAKSFDRGFPGILCSRYSSADIYKIRPYRRKIPVLMTPDDLDPDSLRYALETWLQERKGMLSSTRRPHSVLIRVDGFEDDDDPRAPRVMYVYVAGWNRQEAVAVHLSELPPDVRASFLAGPRKYLHASVNIGAQDKDHLYFSDWEAE